MLDFAQAELDVERLLVNFGSCPALPTISPSYRRRWRGVEAEFRRDKCVESPPLPRSERPDPAWLHNSGSLPHGPSLPSAGLDLVCVTDPSAGLSGNDAQQPEPPCAILVYSRRTVSLIFSFDFDIAYPSSFI
jgi:hypothetical protein